MFVTNWISTTKIQKISEITNFFRHYFLSRTEVTSVNGTGHPTVEDMIAVGVKNKMKEKRCREIYEEVTEQC